MKFRVFQRTIQRFSALIPQLAFRLSRIIHVNKPHKVYYLKAPPMALAKAKVASGFNLQSRTNRIALGLIGFLIFAPIISQLLHGHLLLKGESHAEVYDLKLYPAPSNSAYLYQNTVNGFKIYLGNRMQENKPNVRFEQNNSSAEFVPDFGNSLIGSNSPSDSRPLADENSLLYKNVLPGIDLKYSLNGKGIKEEIIISDQRSVTSDQQFKFALNLRNAVPKKSLEGETIAYFIEPINEEYRFHIPKPFMIDAAGNRSEEVELKIISLSSMSEGGGSSIYEIILAPSQEWLARAVYPVIIDPSVVHDESSEFTGTTNRIEDEGSGTTPKLRTPYHELPADEHTVGLWHMNNDWNDSSGNGYNGTGNGGVTFTTNAKLGSHAGSFAGDNDYVQITSSALISKLDQSTIEAWVNPSAIGSEMTVYGEDTDGIIFRIRISTAGKATFGIHTGSAWVNLDSQTILTTNTWYHIAGVFSKSGGMQVYVNGVLENFDPNTTVNSGIITNVQIGRYTNGGGGGYFNGYIDEVRISNIARTAEEIKQDAQRYPYGVYTSDAIDLTSGEGTVASAELEWTDNVSTPGATLDGYPYFKPVIIDNTQNSNELTDYQVKVSVDYDSNMQTDFDDLRFTSNTQTSSYGSESTFNSATTAQIKTTKLDSTHFVIAYQDAGGSNYGCAKIGNVSGTNISYGDEYCFNEAYTSSISIDAIDSTHFVVVYTGGYAKIGTVSGTSIAYGNTSQFFSNGVDYLSISVVNSAQFIVAYQSSGIDGASNVGTISGNSISFGSYVYFNQSSWTYDVSTAALDSTHFVIAYRDRGGDGMGDGGEAKIGTVSGTSISYGSVYEFYAGALNVSVSALDSTHFAVAWGYSTSGYVKIGTVSGTSIAYNSLSTFNSASTTNIWVSSLSPTRFVVGYKDAGGTDDGCLKAGTISNLNIFYGSEACFNSGNTTYISTLAMGTTSFVVGYNDTGGDTFGHAKVGTVVNTNLDYWIEEKSDGVEADVWVEVDTIPASDLTTIWMWYGNNDASAGSNGANTFVFFDDFNDGSLNGTLWNSAGTVSESGGVVTITNSGSYIGSKTSYGVNYSLRYRGKHPDVESNWVGFISGASPPFAIFERYATGQWNARSYVSAETITGLSLVLLGTYNQYEIERNNGSFNMYSVNDGISSFGTHTTQVTSNNLPLTAYMSGTGSLSLDWIALRSFTSIEPIAGVGADVEFQTRTSSDGSTWEAWKPTTNETQIDSMDTLTWATPSASLYGGVPIATSSATTIKMEGTASMKTAVGAPLVGPNTRGLWHLEETGGSGAYVLDETDLSNDLSVSGTANVTDGFFGKARDFSSGDLSCTDANCGGTTKLDYPGSGGWSVGAWVKLDTLASGADQQIAIKWYWNSGTDNGGYVLQLSDATDNFRFGVANSSGSANYNLLTSTTVPSLDQWYHVVGVYNGLNTKIYVNGVLENTAAYSGGVKDISQDFLIGNLTAHYLNGAIDEPFVTTKALTSEEIAEAYRAGRDHRLQKTISSTDLSGKTKIPFYFAADKQGTIAETYVGETDHAVYGSDSNTQGLWHLDDLGNWWNPSWERRKSITVINNVASGLNNFQVNFTVSFDSDMQTDFDDLRFTNSSGKELDYWIESKTDSSSANVWVELDSLPASQTILIYMYYKNSGASAGSNIGNTFDFGDDFPGSSLDSNKWPNTSGSPAVSSGNLILSSPSGTETVRSNLSFSRPHILEYRFLQTGVNNYSRSGFSNSSAGTNFYADDSAYRFGYNTSSSWSFRSGNEGTTSAIAFGTEDTSWHDFKLIWTASSAIFYIDSSGAAVTSYIPDEACYVRLEDVYDAYYNGDLYIDWVFVRKYASSDPTITQAGEESKNPIKDSSYNGNDGGVTGTSFTQGKIGGARYFSGSASYISVPDSLSLDLTTGMTLEAWVKFAGTFSATQNSVLEKAYYTSSADNGGYQLIVDKDTMGNVGCSVGNNDWDSLSSNSVLTPNTWYHLACTFNGSTLKVYINGKEDNSVSTSVSSIKNISQSFNIGSTSAGYSNFPGFIDEARVSNTARTADEIRLAYQYGIRTHQINVDFQADLICGAEICIDNEIVDENDNNFTISALDYGSSTKAGKIFPGDVIIIRENYNGTEYSAQSQVTTVNQTTGAITVNCTSNCTGYYDSGSTFPTYGYSYDSTVFKWQREYWDLNDISPDDRNATTKLGLRILDANEGFTMYLDDIRSNTNYLTDNSGSTVTSTANRYIQYRAILSTNNTEVTPELTSVTLDYNRYPTAPTSLLTNGLINPGNVLDTTPYFSAIYNDPDEGDVANKYWVQVDDNSDFGSTIWDSGSSGTAMTNCVEGNRCEDITYGGASTDLQWGTQYYWRIKYWDDQAAEGDWSTSGDYFVMATIERPKVCIIDDGSQPSELTITWQDDTTLETGYRIEKDIDDSGFNFLVDKAIDSTSHLDSDTSAEYVYQYRIRAESNNGNSEWCITAPVDFSTGSFMFEGVQMEGVKIE